MKEELVSDFASFAMLSIEDAQGILNFNNKLYYQFVMIKRDKVRIIKTPAPYARLVQYYLIDRLFSKIKLHPSAVAYRKERSSLFNAKLHRHSNYCLRFDLENFFPSIKSDDALNEIKKKAERLISKNEIDSESVTQWIPLIEKYCFDSQNKLPLGFCSSPIISNILMIEFDNRISRELRNIDKKIIYTRYADDIVVSFNDVKLKNKILRSVKDSIKNYSVVPLKINKSKTKFGDRKFGSFFVNGLKVTDDKRITLHRNYKNLIRSLVHKISKGDAVAIASKERIKGHLNYAKHIDPMFYNKIYRNNFEVINSILNGL